MLYPIKVLTLDISLPISDLAGLDGYVGVHLLVTCFGQPMGYCRLPIHNNVVSRSRIARAVMAECGCKIVQHLLHRGLVNPSQYRFTFERLMTLKPSEPSESLALVTVAVCTRDRTAQLDKCLEAISQLDYPHLDVLIIDNAPSSSSTEEMVRAKYVNFRYIREQTPGLNWARNRAVLEAKGEIVAYTDDDVLVDPLWVKALARLFAENPEVKAVTGLVVPAELETEAQVMFEAYGGFGRGFERKWHRADGKIVPWHLLGTGQFGTGANMAFKKAIFSEIGPFDPALDVGTCTNGGGDLEMFFRVLKHGYTLVYEPAAVVRHFHRRSLPELRYQVGNNSKGLVGYIVRSCRAYPDQRYSFFRLWWWYTYNWVFKRMLKSIMMPSDVHGGLHKEELWGCFSFRLYDRAKRKADGFDRNVRLRSFEATETFQPKKYKLKRKTKTAIRVVDLSQPIQAINDIDEYRKTKLFVKWEEQLLGHIDIPNLYAGLSVGHIVDLVATGLSQQTLQPSPFLNEHGTWETVIGDLRSYLEGEPIDTIQQAAFSPSTISVVVASFDRPKDLYECLVSLCNQRTSHTLEIIVVDNHPASGLTPPVVEQFPGVVLVSEEREGLSYARNAGILASTGEIVVTTDDDVIVPSNWAEILIGAFVRRDVAAVTGHVLPYALENDAQHYFEMYGGLGRGYEKKEYGNKWFGSFGKSPVPTWEIGACANAAFRAEIFRNKDIGLLKELLGPGMPSGVGEDTYLFYKILKAGFTIIYEPNAYVWHKHRKTRKAFQKQLFNYSKGHVCYHLVTGIQDGDWRGLLRLIYVLPKYHLTRIIRRLMGRSDYPVHLVLIEIIGNVFGPVALLLSWIKVARGKSIPFRGLPRKLSKHTDHDSFHLEKEEDIASSH